MANELTGREIVVAIKKAAAWRTAVSVGAGDGQFLLSDGLLGGRTIATLRDEPLGLDYVQNSDSGLETVAGDITAWLRYQGQELLLALAMGDSQVKTGAGPTYDWDCYLSTTLRGLFATYVTLLASNRVAEVPSMKVTGLGLSAEFGNPVQVIWHLIGNILRVTGDAGIVNTTTETDAVTIDNDSKDNRVILNENAEFLINAESAGALASPGDRLGIASFNFDFTRPSDAFHIVNATDLGVEEPIGSGFPDPTLEIVLPEFDDTEAVKYLADLRDGDTSKASLTFAKGTDYEFEIFWPRLRVSVDAPSWTGPGRLPNTITFQCLKATAAPTGFNSNLPFYIATKNKVALAPF
jgi:hypothetical protein